MKNYQHCHWLKAEETKWATLDWECARGLGVQDGRSGACERFQELEGLQVSQSGTASV